MSRPMLETAKEEYVPTVYFDFEDRNKKEASAPKNFDDLQVDEEISATVKGKVKMVQHDETGKSFRMTIKEVKLMLPGAKPMGVGKAMSEVQKKRTI